MCYLIVFCFIYAPLPLYILNFFDLLQTYNLSPISHYAHVEQKRYRLLQLNFQGSDYFQCLLYILQNSKKMVCNESSDDDLLRI